MSGSGGNKIIRQAIVRSARSRTSKVAEGSEDILLKKESGGKVRVDEKIVRGYRNPSSVSCKRPCD